MFYTLLERRKKIKNKKLLAIILLSLSFCFVSGVRYGVGLEKDSVSTTQIDQAFAELIEAKRQASQLPERYTFFFIPVEGVFTEFWTFLDMYPDAEIPEEFALILPSEINNVDKMKKNRGFSFFRDFKIYSEFILSLLLTMAYQQDYEIEYVTSNYVILIKPVYEKE